MKVETSHCFFCFCCLQFEEPDCGFIQCRKWSGVQGCVSLFLVVRLRTTLNFPGLAAADTAPPPPPVGCLTMNVLDRRCCCARIAAGDESKVNAAVAHCMLSRDMQSVSSGSHASVGTGDDFDGPGREVLVGARSVASSARVATATSSTCTESDALLPPIAAQSAPVAVPSMKGEMCVHLPPAATAACIFASLWQGFQSCLDVWPGAQLSA